MTGRADPAPIADTVPEPAGPAAPMRVTASLQARLTVVGLGAAALATALAPAVPDGGHALATHVLLLVGAAFALTIIDLGARAARGPDRSFRRAVRTVAIVWLVLHAGRLVSVVAGTALPLPIEGGLLALMALLILRAWPAMLPDRLSRSERFAIGLDAAAVFATVAAVMLFVFGDQLLSDGRLLWPLTQSVLFTGLVGSLSVAILASTPQRALAGWYAVLAGIPLIGIAHLAVLAPSSADLVVGAAVLVIGEVVAAYGVATWSHEADPDERFRAWAGRIRGLLPLAAVGVAPLLVIANELRPQAASGFLTLAIDAVVAVVVGMVIARQTILFRDRDAIAREATVAMLGERDARVDLQRSEERLRALLKHSSDVFLIIGNDHTIRYQSPAVEQVLGYEPEDAADNVGRSIFELLHPDDVEFARSTLAELTQVPGSTRTVEIRAAHANGSWRVVEANGWNLVDDPVVDGIVINYRDVTERKALEGQLIHDAFHDPLTGLANRALFIDRLQHAVTRRSSGDGISVLIMDVDDFKTINDSLGHGAGDQAMIAVANRLRASLRPEDTVSRIGGDEFAVLIEDATKEQVTAVAERILGTLRRPFELGGIEVHLSASIGIAFSGEGTRTADELLRNADVAMYNAKNRGKARAEPFETSMHAAAVARLELKADLEHAVERGELRLRFQPVYELRTNELAGFEALLRWRHPTRGEVMPLDFIPLAEETGLIVLIGNWVLEQACRQAVAWTESAGRPLHISVNVSARQLREPDMSAWVRAALDATGLAPEQLILELTETGLMQDDEGQLREMKALGVHLALDDFGTGYSSLSYLGRFPIDVLKIDQSFVSQISAGSEVPPLVRSVVQLGANLGLYTVAEGVEEPQQLELLREMGVTYGQGYLLGRPMDAIAATRLLAPDAEGAAASS